MHVQTEEIDADEASSSGQQEGEESMASSSSTLLPPTPKPSLEQLHPHDLPPTYDRSELEFRISEAIKDLHPDVLICDLAMPEMDGYEVLENVRRLEPGLGQLPAIAFTAAARDEDRAATRLAGFQAHLAKPIEPDKLVRKVLELFSCK